MVELLGGSLNPFVLPCLGGRLVTPLPLWSKRARPVQGCRLGWGGRSSLLSDPACCMLGQVPSTPRVSISLGPSGCWNLCPSLSWPRSHELVAVRLGWHSWGPAPQGMALCPPPFEGVDLGVGERWVPGS